VGGVVRDEQNAVSLPGVPVEVVGTSEVVYTDVDGRYTLSLTPGTHELKISLDGYAERTVRLEVVAGQREVTADVGLTMARFAETVTVTAQVIDVNTATAEAQLIERKQAQVITDNLGSEEMKANGDSDAAGAMTRVTGVSLVDNQFVFVRGLGERYSNTTLAGSVLPTTEPDKKVVPLDMFPTGLIDSVQIAKSYSPDKSAEFAGGLVQIVPLKLPTRPVVDFSYGLNFFSTATGQDIVLSPLGTRDWLGFDNGSRALPSAIPDGKIVRRGVFTPNVGFSPEEITAFGRTLDNTWRPATASGAPGQSWNMVFGNRFGKLGVVASVNHSYKEQYVEEDRRFFRISEGTDLEAVSDYRMQSGTQRAQIGAVANLAYEVTTNHRLSFENFYTHSGRDEGRYFEGPNTENQFLYRNYRVQYIEEGLFSNAVGGEHFLQGLSSSRIDWRVNIARANRDEPDLRETLYQSPLTGTPNFVLADESQSGFRMFNTLEDKTTDLAGNWSVFSTTGGRPTQYKFGLSYIERDRDFASRRFRFIPITTTSGGSVPANLRLTPEELFVPSNIGTAFRFNEETRPVDSYRGEQSTTGAYGMLDLGLSNNTRLIAGARVERFNQVVDTFDPFGLFQRTVSAENRNTDLFPSLNLVQTLNSTTNLRVSYSTTVNRPEFRELAEFEFTDVVGSRAVRGNPDLNRALIHNVDGRWEMFGGGRDVIATSIFFKQFSNPIERVVIAGAQPIVTFQNADSARNLGFEFEAGRQVTPNLFVNANYTFVNSNIKLNPAQRTVQTSLERSLAGQSKNLFNVAAEFSLASFSGRVLYNYFGDRISDVGSNQAPDVVEQGRGTIDLVFSQRLAGLGVKFSVENLTDVQYRFTQGIEDQRLFRIGRTIALSFGYNVF
ncbi:MAG: TonB-dependent receptor, partial [Acidobacteria bacterium]|nr:TonB-dependent receptor [Acidobacteriota bacterium]